MGDEQTWSTVLDIISGYQQPVVVVSATARTTRQLILAAESAPDQIEKAYEISSEIQTRHEQIVDKFLARHSPGDEKYRDRCMEWIREHILDLNDCLDEINRTKTLNSQIKDEIASFGERLSSYLFAECGTAYGLPTTYIDARTIIKTDADFGGAAPLVDEINDEAVKLNKVVEEGRIPVIGGYYGEDDEGTITTLGFEGSDYTASLIGAALNVDTIEIWTDVSGIYTCDPRVIPGARPIPELSFAEATEMAYFGAKVLHPSTLNPAAEQNIPVMVKNIFSPDDPGTRIHAEASAGKDVRALTFLEDIVIITVSSPRTVMGYRFLANVFDILRNFHVAVDVVTTTEASVSIAIKRPDDLARIQKELSEVGRVSLSENRGLVSLIGCTFETMGEIAELSRATLGETEVSLISYNRANRNLNIVLPEEALISAIKAVHRYFWEDF